METQTMPLQAVPEKSGKKSRESLLLAVTSSLVGALGGFGVVKLIEVAGVGKVPLALLPCIFVVFFLAIALHEAGHVAAGLLCGFRFFLYVVGPLRIEAEGDGLKFSLNRAPILWGGVAVCLPQSYGPELKRQMGIFVAGGPLASLVGAIALIPAFLLGGVHPTATLFLLTFGILSPLIGLVTLVPVTSSGFVNDGARLKMLLFDQPEGRRWMALSTIASLCMAQRPREWPEPMVELMGDGLDSDPGSVHACWLRHMWHLDRGEMDPAKMWLDRGLARVDLMPKPMQPGLHLAAALFYALPGYDLAVARKHLELGRMPGIHNKNEIHAPSAAVLSAEGNKAAALKELELAFKALKSQPGKLGVPIRERLEALRLELNG